MPLFTQTCVRRIGVLMLGTIWRSASDQAGRPVLKDS